MNYNALVMTAILFSQSQFSAHKEACSRPPTF